MRSHSRLPAFVAGLALVASACGGADADVGVETDAVAAPAPVADAVVQAPDARPVEPADAAATLADLGPVTPPDARPEPTPWLADAGAGGPEPALDATGVGDALAAVLGQAVRHGFGATRAAYETMMALGDADCPGVSSYPHPEGGTVFVWDADCTTAGGVRFRGTSAFRVTNGESNPDGRAAYGFGLDAGGGFEITAPDGRSLSVAAYIYDMRTEGPDWIDQGTYAGGRFHAAGGLEGDDPWLTGALEGQIGFYVGRNPDGTYHSASTSSSLAHPADGLTGALLDEVDSWTDIACPGEPRGQIALRDANGVWHAVVFDANPVADDAPTPDAALCDGCGAWWVRGAEVGRVCLPPSAMDAFRSWRE